MELYKNQMLQTFDTLTRNNGASLQHFLNHITCSQLQSRMLKCTLPQYYTSISNTWQNINLVDDKDVPMLDNIKLTFLKLLQEEIISYFPQDELLNFNVFDPKKWPQSEDALKLFGQESVTHLATIFGIPSQQIAQHWKILILSICAEKDFCRYQKSEPIPFWSHYLQVEFPVVRWQNDIKKLIMIILVLPIGSADAERGFSIMNHIRTNRRASIKSATLDAMMRIRINGPDKLEQFDAQKYSKLWVAGKHLRSDTTLQQGAIKRKSDNLVSTDSDETDYKTYMKKSRLF
jgi:hypothetical protein